MARSIRSTTSLPVALELLSTEHRKAEALFDRYEEQKEAGEESRRELAERICGELTEHTRLEEEILYPWLREHLDRDSADLVDEALVEHASAKELIAQIQDAAEVDETYDARVKVLGEYVRHHVREEENEIFPQVASEAEELDELGQEMHARRAELREELGLPEADDAEDERAIRVPARTERDRAARPRHPPRPARGRPPLHGAQLAGCRRRSQSRGCDIEPVSPACRLVPAPKARAVHSRKRRSARRCAAGGWPASARATDSPRPPRKTPNC